MSYLINSILFRNRFSSVFVHEHNSLFWKFFFMHLAVNWNSGIASFSWDRIKFLFSQNVLLVDNAFWIVGCLLCFSFFDEILNLFMLYLNVQTEGLVLSIFEFGNFFLNECSRDSCVKICWEVGFYKKKCIILYFIRY